MKKLSPYIEHCLNCAITGQDPNPDDKFYRKLELWDEIINTHVWGMNAALRISQQAEEAMRIKARENNDNDSNEQERRNES
ncbi:MAG TPA: hypothetical protein PLU95_02795 [Syntrophales bacterium]|jgi:hypothetical protein|nr:hypothetical protein [Syntrophales bacterium]HOH73461.1 hypothetical protein [Syntrophales bacterium]HPN08204.1 hypothetical protein [Syntrophales bacterium]HQB14050.1 hypothetical protein [Syntrophales bacterium]